MISRIDVFKYIKEIYNTEPEYLWRRTPNYAVLRHKINRKWYGAIIDVTEDKLGLKGNRKIDVLLLKCDPFLIDSLKGTPGILPGYHMNKEHWISVLLDGAYPENKIFELIGISYNLTK